MAVSPATILQNTMKLLLTALFCLLPFFGAKHFLVETDDITEETDNITEEIDGITEETDAITEETDGITEETDGLVDGGLETASDADYKLPRKKGRH